MESTANQQEISNIHKRRLTSLIAYLKWGRSRYVIFLSAFGVVCAVAMLFGMKVLLNQQLSMLAELDPSARSVLAEVNQSLNYLIAAACILLGIAVACTTTVGILVMHHIYGPMIPLIRHLRRLESGDYSGRVHLRAGDELVDLMNAINGLTESLQKQAHEVPKKKSRHLRMVS